MNPHTETLPAPSPARRFRELPPAVGQVLAAARRIDPAYGLFVSYAPGTRDAPWEFHPFKRWLILRSLNPESIVEAVACSLLARTEWLGKGTVTAVPARLETRFQQVLDRLATEFNTQIAFAPGRETPSRSQHRPWQSFLRFSRPRRGSADAPNSIGKRQAGSIRSESAWRSRS